MASEIKMIFLNVISWERYILVVRHINRVGAINFPILGFPVCVIVYVVDRDNWTVNSDAGKDTVDKSNRFEQVFKIIRAAWHTSRMKPIITIVLEVYRAHVFEL